MKSSSLKEFLIKKLGGFIDIDEYLENIPLKDKHNLLSRAVKKMFNTISSEDILKEHETGQWSYQNKPISDAEKKLLIAEAKQLLSTKLWKILQDDIKFQANRKMFLLSKTNEDLTAGKLWLFTLDAFNQRLENIINNKGNFNN